MSETNQTAPWSSSSFRHGDFVRMAVTLQPMLDPEFTKMSSTGFSSQLTKLDARFELRSRT